MAGHEDLSEAKTRQELIDKQLARAGWDVKNREHVIAELELFGVEREADNNGSAGFVDYVLLSAAGDPLAIVEAKRTSKDPITGKKQAEQYADAIKKHTGFAPCIFLANGDEIWFYDRPHYGPRLVKGFFTRDDISRIVYQSASRKSLTAAAIKPEIIDRDYQIEAAKRVFEGLEQKKRKFLLVMATGTGKTRTAMAIIDVLLRYGWVKRVLFLVDRIELAVQAEEAFKKHLPHDSPVSVKSGNIPLHHRLYVSTLQTISECYQTVSPAFFDLVISDECHRSIYNKWESILSYYDAYQIGLTATPSELIDRDTFKMFDCPDGKPDFLFSYEDAIAANPPYLCRFVPYAARTRFQIKGIKAGELPLSIRQKLIEDGVDLEQLDFEGTDLERKVVNLDTNRQLVKEFMEECLKDEAGVLPGKSIIFAMSKAHAHRLWEAFEELYPQYGGKLAEIIHSDVSRAKDLIKQFKRQDFPRVAISVDMLDTGIDVPEVVNLVFAKPVFSRIKFWQMIGRGTRPHSVCERKDWLPNGRKEYFIIFDHMGNFEFFRMHPEGKLPSAAEALPVSIFKTKLEKLRLLLLSNDEDALEDLILGLRKDIEALPKESITVKDAAKVLRKASSDDFWKEMSLDSVNYLSTHIAPLMKYRSDVDPEKGRFLLKAERLSLAILKHEPIDVLKVSVEDDLKRLPLTIDEVKREKESLAKALSPDFWANLTYEDVEFLKERFSDLMKHQTKERSELITLDLEDEVIERRWIVYGPSGEGEYVKKYREKVEKAIKELADFHPTILKIKRNEQITNSDLEALEKTLNEHELFINESNLRKAYNQEGTLVEFIKHILGMYKFPDPQEVISEAFDSFIVRKNYFNSNQIRFLRTVKSVFLKKRHIEMKDLLEPPFTQFGLNAPVKLFKQEELEEIIAFTKELEASPVLVTTRGG